MEEFFRERPAAAAALAVGAEGQDEEQEEEGEEEGEIDGRPANTSTAEVVVLDSDGDLDTNEEGLVVSKEEENGHGVNLESNGRGKGRSIAAKEGEEEEDEEDEKDDVRAALSELEDMITQFLPKEEEGNRVAEGVATAVTAATAATTDTSAATALAITLVCSRCLHAHLGTTGITLGSPVSSCLSVSSYGAATRVIGCGQRDDEGGEGEEFLRLLKERCSVSDAALEARHRNENEVASKHISLPTAKGIHSEAKLRRGIATEESVTTSSIEGDEGVETDNGGSSCSTKDDVPEFLLQLEAGWVLASAVWEGVTLLEKVRDYKRAVELLTQLLATR